MSRPIGKTIEMWFWAIMSMGGLFATGSSLASLLYVYKAGSGMYPMTIGILATWVIFSIVLLAATYFAYNMFHDIKDDPKWKDSN